MMEESVNTFETHVTAVMDSLIRASVCEITKLFQETVNDYLVELSLNRSENEALKVRLKLTENKLRSERKYGMSWAAHRRNAGLAGDGGAAVSRQRRKAELASTCFSVLGGIALEWLSLKHHLVTVVLWQVPVIELHKNITALYFIFCLRPVLFCFDHIHNLSIKRICFYNPVSL